MIVKPYLKENPDFKGLNVIEHGLNYENIWDLKFFTSCFLESLRLEPPVTVSSACMVSEDQTLGGINIKTGDGFLIDMKAIHWNPEEWIEPSKYIPDRFDPESSYYLTPSGQKRHPMSFAPFLGGKRVCVGKTFAEAISKISGPNLIYNFDF